MEDVALLELDFGTDELDFASDELLVVTEDDESESEVAEVELSHPIKEAIIIAGKMELRKNFIVQVAPNFFILFPSKNA